VGSNFVPADAINQLEMWQADTFNPAEIDKELGWAEGLGMTTMRVFLHDLLWEQDSKGFVQRIDTFLKICDKHKIKPLFVLFDSCWDPNPHLGKQRAPRPGVHNSGWVQSPGAQALNDPTQYPRLEAYTKGVVGAFAKDERVLGWDIWNEPDNSNDSSYGANEPAQKAKIILDLLARAFEWARSASPLQPLTSGVWRLGPMHDEQLALSDIVTFHNYGKPADFAGNVKELRSLGRPIVCTEYMARPEGSTFEGILPIAKAERVGAINWGFVLGKTQTNMPWDSWSHPYVDRPPAVWFHDIFYADGKPYRSGETELIRKLTGN
jgi:hypothetical protein